MTRAQATFQVLQVGNGNLSVHHWLDLYHFQRDNLGADHYAAISWWWLATAFRALESKPTLYPVAVVIGHLVSFMESRGRKHPGGGIAGNSPFNASTSELALLGLDASQVGVGLKMLAEAGLLSIEPREGRDPIITITCGPRDRKRLREEYQGLINDGPASRRRRAKGRKSQGGAPRTPQAVANHKVAGTGYADTGVVTIKVARVLTRIGWSKQEDAADTWTRNEGSVMLRVRPRPNDMVRVLVDGLGFADARRLDGDDDSVTIAKSKPAHALGDPARSWTITYPDLSSFEETFIRGLRKLLVRANPIERDER